MNPFNQKQITLLAFLLLLFGLSNTSNAQESANQINTAKVFGGRGQYRTWSVGLHAGALSPVTVLGGKSDYNDPKLNLGYDLSLRKQLGHAFGLEADFLKGNLSANNENSSGASLNNNKSFSTELGWSVSLMGVINVATVDFIRRKNAVNFLVKAGYGYAGYASGYIDEHTQSFELKGTYGADGNNTYLKKQFIPLGVGVKFKMSNRLNFNLGYNMYYLNADNLDGIITGDNNDKWSYGYGGLELSLGSAAKPNLDWVNPLALMYDELKDPTLRQELEALRNRVNTLEAADLLKDTDGDGVADKLDKCPNTEAGVKVDGSGCPLDVDADGVPDSKDSCPTEKGTPELNGCPATTASTNAIQFEFNSAVLKTSDYAFLDQLSTDLRSGTLNKIELDGHASEEGTAEYNMQLSKDRANAVKTYLVNSGVPATQMVTKGLGETRPIASNSTEEGRQQNRRVEIVRQ